MKLSPVIVANISLLIGLQVFASEVTVKTANNQLGLSTAVINGEKITPNQAPFFARLILHRQGSNTFADVCGGTIVNDRYIMTAAHCVGGDVFSNGWSEDDLRVLVKNPSGSDVYVQEFKDVKTITQHPDYNESDLWINDIAILELSYPITDNVQSITLPQDFGDYSAQSVYQIFGLGQTSSNDTSGADYLLTADVRPLTDSQCASLVSGYHSQETLCANGFPNKPYTGICRGDSGGPLTYLDNDGSYQQIGIVSYGSSVCESPSIPSVFTEVLNYTTWIERLTSSGTKTVYDASKAASEDYYSEGDSGFEPQDTVVTETDSGGGSGGGLSPFLFIFLLPFSYLRRRYAV